MSFNNIFKALKVTIYTCILALLGVVAYWAIIPNQSPYWTGFGSYLMDGKLVPEKKLWDWLDLLLVPILLAFGAWVLSKTESDTDRRRETDRFEHENISNYLELMTQLLLQYKLKEENKTERSVARTQSLRILQQISRAKKGQILQFLFESELISMINLNGADFNNSDMDHITLAGSQLRGVYLTNCSLRKSNLRNADFSGSDFSGSDLTDALVEGANFDYTKLNGAILRNVDFTTAILTDVDLTGADLRGAIVTESQFQSIKDQKIKKLPNRILI